MINVSVTLHALISTVCYVPGLAFLILAGLGFLPTATGFLGIALCFIGNLCYFQGRIEAMEDHNQNVFNLGRDSVRSIR